MARPAASSSALYQVSSGTGVSATARTKATLQVSATGTKSRIQDADFAAETGNLTRGQVLQKAGMAMLAQANALPNQVMALLR